MFYLHFDQIDRKIIAKIQLRHILQEISNSALENIRVENIQHNLNIIKLENLYSLDGDDGKVVDDGTHLDYHVPHNFVPLNVDVEMGQLIVSSYPIRLNRLLH